MKIPFKWKLRWFLQGMASVFGNQISVEQKMLDIQQCADAIMMDEFKSTISMKNKRTRFWNLKKGTQFRDDETMLGFIKIGWNRVQLVNSEITQYFPPWEIVEIVD